MNTTDVKVPATYIIRRSGVPDIRFEGWYLAGIMKPPNVTEFNPHRSSLDYHEMHLWKATNGEFFCSEFSYQGSLRQATHQGRIAMRPTLRTYDIAAVKNYFGSDPLAEQFYIRAQI